ncbi:hypothetical protein RIF29_39735 [Crotalaria pallida]|uniref:Retrotransposon gag domain-containing protein n=1 Tax=Crotalaria pallida TaxID=3830 RepID=A0AAN9HQ20_CROPI
MFGLFTSTHEKKKRGFPMSYLKGDIGMYEEQGAEQGAEQRVRERAEFTNHYYFIFIVWKSCPKQLATPLGRLSKSMDLNGEEFSGARSMRQPVTTRHLSFNLETPGEEEKHVQQPQEEICVTPPRPERGPELNLLRGLDTPLTNLEVGSPHVTIPASVLASLLDNQNNLTKMVAEMQSQVARKEGRGEMAHSHLETHPPRMEENALVTQAQVRRMLEAHHGGSKQVIDIRPPFSAEVMMCSFPMRYVPLAFRKFDGTGSAREHIMTFLDDLGIYSQDKHLRLREFSKSLTGRAFTWYTKLRPTSINTWEEMVAEFCNKFLEEESVLHIMDLGDKALHCKETLPEADLVYGCIKNVEDGAQIFLSLSGITTFAELMKRGADVAEAMRRQGKRTKEDAMLEVYAVDGRGKKKDYKETPPPRKYGKNEVPPPQKVQMGRQWSTPYYPQSNGQAEATNKILLHILRRTVSDTPKDWSEYLPLALWAYRTTRHGTTKATPFSLVYGAEAVLPVEVAIPSARMIIGSNEDRLGSAELVEGEREKAQGEMLKHHRQVMLMYDKMVRPRMFVEGELVLKAVDAVMRNMHMNKWAPKWEGPYIIQETHPNGYCFLLDPDSQKRMGPLNFRYIKKYYP